MNTQPLRHGSGLFKQIMADLLMDKPGRDPLTREQILERAGEMNIPECVACEWANEPHRRAVAWSRRERKKDVKLVTKKTDYGRIIRTKIVGRRELQLHATKGVRDRRVVT